MDNKIEMLKEGIEALYHKYEACVEKMRDGGKLTSEDMMYFDQLTHSLKSLETIKAMKEATEGGYSERGGYSDRRDAMGHYSRDGGMYGGSYGMDGRSYADGYAERYARGYAYADGGYSRNDQRGVAEETRNMVGELDEAKQRQVQRFIRELHQQGQGMGR